MNALVALVSTLATVLLATAVVLHYDRFTAGWPVRLSRFPVINQQCKYQILLLVVAAAVALVAYRLDAAQFLRLVAVGDVHKAATGVAVFGIADGESWAHVGVVLGVLIASLTFLFVYLKTRPHGRYSAALFGYAPWVFLFAASNSLSEEVIYRLGIVAPLLEHLPVPVVLLLSAAVFGLLHYRGTPNGLFGAALAAVLGWILAKSMVETAGIFWAWSVHFLQDLVIFPALIILSAPGHADARRWWQRMRPG